MNFKAHPIALAFGAEQLPSLIRGQAHAIGSGRVGRAMSAEQEAAAFPLRLIWRRCMRIDLLVLVFVLPEGSLRSMNRKRSAYSRGEDSEPDEPAHEIDGSTSSLSTESCG